MTSDYENRRKELEQELRDTLDKSYSKDIIEKLLEKENELRENKNLLVTLRKRKVISDDDFFKKINACFEVFISEASNIIGETACIDIYEFAPGETIELAQNPNHRSSLGKKRYNLWEETYEKIVELEKLANELTQTADTINDITAQTNLLTLNATIEAARAGEEGRAFAEVAKKIRQIASRTQSAYDKISKKMTEVKKFTKTIKMAFDETTIPNELTEIMKELSSTVEYTFEIENLLNKDIGAIATGEYQGPKKTILSSLPEGDSLASAMSGVTVNLEDHLKYLRERAAKFQQAS